MHSQCCNEMNFRNQISIAMRKMSSVVLNTSVFRNYKESVQWFVKNNQGSTFMKQCSAAKYSSASHHEQKNQKTTGQIKFFEVKINK